MELGNDHAVDARSASVHEAFESDDSHPEDHAQIAGKRFSQGASAPTLGLRTK